MVSILTARMTDPFPGVVSDQHRASVPGVAHFAKTGPADKTCRECGHWGGDEPGRFRREAGHLRPKRCDKFRRLMQGTDGPGVPSDTPSCRHFIQRENPPAVHPARGPYAKD